MVIRRNLPGRGGVVDDYLATRSLSSFQAGSHGRYELAGNVHRGFIVGARGGTPALPDKGVSKRSLSSASRSRPAL